MKSLVIVCEVLEGNVALCLKKIVNLQIEFYEDISATMLHCAT